MRRNISIEHLEDTVTLAYLDGELSRALARKVKEHLHNCWKCRHTVVELEDLAQTAFTLLAGRDEADSTEVDDARGEFIRRKANIDAAWNESPKQRTSLVRPAAVSSM